MKESDNLTIIAYYSIFADNMRWITHVQLRPFLNFNTHPCALYAPKMNMLIEAFQPQSATAYASLSARAVGISTDVMTLISHDNVKRQSGKGLTTRCRLARCAKSAGMRCYTAFLKRRVRPQLVVVPLPAPARSSQLGSATRCPG